MAGDLTIHADSYYESFSVETFPGFSHGQLLATTKLYQSYICN